MYCCRCLLNISHLLNIVPNISPHVFFSNMILLSNFYRQIHCSALQLWVGYFIYFKFTLVFFLMDVFNSVKERNLLLKEINRLLSKIMLNIYRPGSYYWETSDIYTQNFAFLSLKSSSPGQFLRSSNSRRYHWILKLFVATYKSEIWEQNCVCLYYFYFERNYDNLWLKSPCFLLNRNINFNKIPHTVLEKLTLCFNLYKNFF